MHFSKIVLYGSILICLLGPSLETPQFDSVAPEQFETGLVCTVCDCIVEDGHMIWVKGRKIPIHRDQDHDCMAKFSKDPEKYFVKFQPSSALFQEIGIENPAHVRAGWIFLGLLMVTALLSGGFAAYFSVDRGYSAPTWFFIGLALNFFGVILIKKKTPQSVLFQATGLVKLPSTYEPIPCAQCAKTNHPSAKSCSKCNAALIPQISSDLDKVG